MMLRRPVPQARRRSAASLAVLLVFLCASLAAVVLPGGATTATAQVLDPPDERPNIMFIITDDQREGFDVMPRTRHFFGAGGRAYPNHFVTTPMCCPSRASIMTGRYAHNHNVHHNGVGDDFPITETLQAKLQAAGYRTGMFGKYLNRWPQSVSPPNFDSFAMSNFGYLDRSWNVNGTVSVIEGYNTDIVGDKAVDFIASNRGGKQPWMMFVTPFAPHSPYTPEPAYEFADVPAFTRNPAMLEADRRDKPPFIQEQNQRYRWKGLRTRRQQYRTLRSVDDLVTRLAGELRRNEEQNTIAIYLSDNGFLWGEHGFVGKTVPYNASVNVPMYIRWPGVIEGGTVDERLVANIDIMPTLLRAVGVEPTEGEAIDGRELFDASGAQTAWTRDRLLLEYWCIQPQFGCHRWASTRTLTSQFTEYYNDEGKVSFREYYDLTADPWQLTNLYRDGVAGNSPRIAPLRDQLAADRVCVSTACP